MQHRTTRKDLMKTIIELEEESRMLMQRVKDLRERVSELKTRRQILTEANKALKVIIQQREENNKEIEERAVSNIRRLILPYLHKLKESKSDPQQRLNIDALEAGIHSITSPFCHTLATRHPSLTSREIQMANLIKEGKHAREIAALMYLTPRTVSSHAYRMRRKMGLRRKNGFLRACLLRLQQNSESKKG